MITLQDEDKRRPLFARVPEEIHAFLESIEQQVGINKTLSTWTILAYAMKFFDAKDILKIYDELTLQGGVNNQIVKK